MPFRKLFTAFSFIFFFVVSTMFTACTNTKKATSFYGTQDGVIASTTPVPESIIQKNDILSITVSSLNPEASMVFNLVPVAGSSGVNNAATAAGSSQGYLVGTDGFIQFPVLGNVKAEGLTKTQLKEKIKAELLSKKLLLDPIVSIRFLNFRITVLGEVSRPTVVSVPNEKISLLEAIGLAGDLTIYAQRDNVMIIREEKDQKIIKRINLNSSELFTSPYYYLQSNDIIYVEPNKARVASASRSTQLLPIIFSGLAFVVIVLDRVIE